MNSVNFEASGIFLVAAVFQSLPGVHPSSRAIATIDYFHETKAAVPWSWPLKYGDIFICSNCYRVVFFILLLIYLTDFTLVVKHWIQQLFAPAVPAENNRCVYVCLVCVEKEWGRTSSAAIWPLSGLRRLPQCSSVQCSQLGIPFWSRKNWNVYWSSQMRSYESATRLWPWR
jgi:hypothetical protein